MFSTQKLIVMKISSVICMSNDKNGTGSTAQGTRTWMLNKILFLRAP